SDLRRCQAGGHLRFLAGGLGAARAQRRARSLAQRALSRGRASRFLPGADGRPIIGSTNVRHQGTPVRALGIDPGLVRTGWAVVEPSGFLASVQAHGVIAPPTDLPLPARLANGARRLREIVAEFHPDFVALEEIFTAPRHPKSALLMAHMR